MKLSYFTKLSGVSFRQKEVAKLKDKTPLRVLAINDNEYDQYACEVQALLDSGWTQIGWIQKGKNQNIHEFLNKGGEVKISLKEVTGEDKDTLGVNVAIEYGNDDSLSSGEFQKLEKQRVDFGDEPFIYWDKENHKAYAQNGMELQSGSATEHRYDPDPDLAYPAKAIAKKTGLKAEDILDVWECKSELSKMYGTLIHRAIEIRLTYGDVMHELDLYKGRTHNACNWMPPFVADAVNSLVDFLYKKENINPDFINTEARLKYKNLTGIADLVVKDDAGNFTLYDYKTNNEIKEVKYDVYGKLTKYTLQQNHYRTIMEKLGYHCNGMYLLHWTGKEWKKIQLKEVNIDDEIRA